MICTMIIMHGCSGSGKSTLLKEWLEKPVWKGQHLLNKDVAIVCSTDDYWIRPDGRYDFNFNVANEAHLWNQKRAREACEDECLYVVIDNTNLNFGRIKPYLDIAKEFGYDVEILESQSPWRYDAEELAKRNAHGVPLETIQHMLAGKEDIEVLRQKTNEYMGSV